MTGSEHRSLLWASFLFLLVGCGGVSSIQDPFNKGVYHYGQGNYDEAIAEYKLALDRDPGDNEAEFNLAVTLEALAERVLRDARNLAQAGGASSEDSATLRAQELKDEAARRYDAILVRSPHHVRATINAAARLREQDQLEKARSMLLALAEHHPTAVEPKVAVASLLADEKEFEAAEAQIRAAAELDPANVDLNLMRGRVAERLAKPEEARDAYQKALKREPDDLTALLALGRLEFEAKNHHAAKEAYRRVLYLHPRSYITHYHLAQIHEQDGKLRDAAYHWWQAEALDRSRPKEITTRPDYRAELKKLYRKLEEEAP